MAEPYSDEDFKLWLIRFEHTADVGYADPRAVASVRRLLCERDEARRQRDEARQHAYVLAGYATAADEPLTENELASMLAALAYPEVPHG